MLVPFAKQSRPGSHSGERLVNYVHQPNPDGTGLTMGRTGLLESEDIGAAVYAQSEMGGFRYAITSTAVFKISGTTKTQIGTIAGNSDVRVAASIDEIAIVTNNRYYICDGTTVTEYTTGAVTNPKGVAFLDGYFVVIGTAGGRGDALTVSSLDDGTTFNALDFVFAESEPDALVAVIADHGELWLFGKTTVEIYYNSGNLDFPFTRNSGARIEHGCINGLTVEKADNTVFWHGNDGKIRRSSGISPQVISTPEVEAAILAKTVDRAFSFSDRGQEFYAIRMTTGPTWVYNMRTGLWCEFSSGIDHKPWIALCAIWCGGVQYFGTSTGAVCTHSGYSDDGEIVRAEMISQPIERDGEYFSINKMHVNFATGSDNIGSTPNVALEISKDGKTWGNEKWRALADQGHYMRRATWHGLGAARWLQGKLWITDAVDRDMIGGKMR